MYPNVFFFVLVTEGLPNVPSPDFIVAVPTSVIPYPDTQKLLKINATALGYNYSSVSDKIQDVFFTKYDDPSCSTLCKWELVSYFSYPVN